MRPRAVRARRGGMTLIEIMISLVLVGIISGVIMRVIERQQRFYNGVNQIMGQRGQLRQATSVLPIDLRSLSSVGNDILAVTDSSIDFRVNVGSGVVCEKLVGGKEVVLPPLDLDNGQTLTTWFGGSAPPSGSTVWIYNDSSQAGNEEDIWQKLTLKDVHLDSSKCLTSVGFGSAADLGKNRITLELTSTEPNDPVTGGPVSQYIRVGAPVRITKRVRYALVKRADGKSYLAFADYDKDAADFKDFDLVSGPYDPRTSTSATGLGFRYYDVDGVEIAPNADDANRARIARIDLIARARTGVVRAAGIQNGVARQYQDSLAATVMLRNRR